MTNSLLADLVDILYPAGLAIGAFVVLLWILQGHADKAFNRVLKLKRRRREITAGHVTATIVDHLLTAPRRATKDAAGYDIFLLDEVVLEPGLPKVIPTGVFLEIPEGLFGMMRPRGSAMKAGIHISGTIDSDYRGEVMVVATNLTRNPIIVERGKAIAQMILLQYAALPIVEVNELSNSVRQENRFGSSGSSVK